MNDIPVRDRFLVPQQIHILAGASGAGKSSLIIQQLAAWYHGTSPLIPELSLDSFNRIAWVAADRGGDLHAALVRARPGRYREVSQRK